MSSVSVVFPCLNEEKTLGLCLQRAHATLKATGRSYEIIVADNGSTDQSVALARSLGARVVHIKTPGYGAAVSGGLAEARNSVAVMLDCDLSYPVEEIPKLLEQVDLGFDFVLGNRLGAGLEKGAMPVLHQRLGTPVLSTLIRVLTGMPVYDSNSGLRAVRREALAKMSFCSTGMELASEMLMDAARIKVKYKEIPIRFVKDQRGRRPHLRPVADGLRHVRLIIRSHFKLHS